MAMRPPRSVIATLLCQSPLSDVILSFSEESRYLCTPLSTGGRDKSEGDLQMGSLEHPLQADVGAQGIVPIYP